jgi:hypothetical protein
MYRLLKSVTFNNEAYMPCSFFGIHKLTYVGQHCLKNRYMVDFIVFFTQLRSK